ncbi:hypothetical protein [Actinomadura alba]|uniref:Uncharacterized protein n=1 Tax=Actinomadura alba TaxID=406431 RepID=A0ABR7LJY2_9ACTN|nr:hypothetical protein [Actinomadura alba]MBC6465060.1 hypothetical protein [Actinomadura alba]
MTQESDQEELEATRAILAEVRAEFSTLRTAARDSIARANRRVAEVEKQVLETAELQLKLLDEIHVNRAKLDRIQLVIEQAEQAGEIVILVSALRAVLEET